MDLILWTRYIAPLIVLIFVIYVIVSSNRAHKKIIKAKLEANNDVSQADNSEDIFLPNMDGYSVGELEHNVDNSSESIIDTNESSISEENQVTPTMTDPIHLALNPAITNKEKYQTPMQESFLLDHSLELYRQGIILSTILSKPKALRDRI